MCLPTKSEHDYRVFFESLPELYLVLEPDAPRYTIAAVTNAYARATLWRPEDIVGRGLFELFLDDPADPSATGVGNLAASLDRVVRSRAPDAIGIQRYEIRRPPDQGGGSEERCWSSVNFPVIAASGEVIRILHRVEAEPELLRGGRRSEAIYSGIVAISADAIVSIDESQRITLFNQGAEKIYGYSEDEALGATIDMLIPERFRAAQRAEIERFAAGKATAGKLGDDSPGIFGLRKNGQEFPADASISKLELGGERIVTIALRDITVQKRAESKQRFLSEVGEILASTLDYEQTMANIADLAVREFADLCIVDIFEDSGEIRRLRTICRDPALAWACDVLTRVPIDRARPHIVWPTLTTGRPVLIETFSSEMIASFAQNEERLQALQAIDPGSAIVVTLLARDQPVGLMAFISSKQSRRYGAEDLQLAEALARRASLSIENARLYRTAQRAIRARDEVLSIVAHDLRNPLNSILLQTELLTLQGQSQKMVRAPAEAIRRGVQRMDRLIRDLLDVTRLDASSLTVEREPVAAARLAAESVEIQHASASAAAIELRLEVARDIPDLWADRHRLLQVLENLVGNAIKFTGAGGSVTVRVAPRDGEVLFCVADTGAGIPAEYLPHVFDRFWQARRNDRSGTGLGLPIAKGLVEAHGGRIWIESAPGRGTSVFFTVPQAPRTGREEPTVSGP